MPSLAAKNDQAHRHLSMQFEARSTEKEYLAVVCGDVEFDSDVITESLGRLGLGRLRVRNGVRRIRTIVAGLKPSFAFLRLVQNGSGMDRAD